MAEPTNNLIYEVLKNLQADMGEVKEGLRTANRRLSSIETHMAGFHSTVATHSDTLDTLKARIACIERRLELSDAPAEH